MAVSSFWTYWRWPPMKTFLDGPSIGLAPSVLAFFPWGRKNGRKGGLESVNNHLKKFPEKMVWECHRKRVYPAPTLQVTGKNGVSTVPQGWIFIPSSLQKFAVWVLESDWGVDATSSTFFETNFGKSFSSVITFVKFRDSQRSRQVGPREKTSKQFPGNVITTTIARQANCRAILGRWKKPPNAWSSPNFTTFLGRF